MTRRFGIATNYASGLRYWVEVDASGDIIRAREGADQLHHPRDIAHILDNADAQGTAETARDLMRCSPVYVEIAA